MGEPVTFQVALNAIGDVHVTVEALRGVSSKSKNNTSGSTIASRVAHRHEPASTLLSDDEKDDEAAASGSPISPRGGTEFVEDPKLKTQVRRSRRHTIMPTSGRLLSDDEQDDTSHKESRSTVRRVKSAKDPLVTTEVVRKAKRSGHTESHTDSDTDDTEFEAKMHSVDKPDLAINVISVNAKGCVALQAE